MLVEDILRQNKSSMDCYPTHLDEGYAKNKCENYVGNAEYPVGLVGPLKMDGEYAKGEFVIPFATIEGTLVASATRGCRIFNESAEKLGLNGVESVVVEDRFLRSVSFKTKSLSEAMKLRVWIKENVKPISARIEASDPFIKVDSVDGSIHGSNVILSITVQTGDAMGSNMASKAAAEANFYVEENCTSIEFSRSILPIPEDKKFILARQKGKKVVSRVILDREVVQKRGRASIDKVAEFITSIRSFLTEYGTTSLNVHAGNGLAALYLAFGQDVAYLGECCQAIVEANFLTPDQLEVTMTFPSLIIGTVGGGTSLPGFQRSLALIGCVGKGTVKKMAEIFGAATMALELNCIIAQAAYEFVSAHERMGKNDPLAMVQSPATPNISAEGEKEGEYEETCISPLIKRR